MILSSTIITKNITYSFVLLINLASLLLFQDNLIDVQQDYINFLYFFNVVQSFMNMALIALSLWLLLDTNKETWIDRIPENIKKFFHKKRKK